MFVRAKKRGNRTYLMIVKNERVKGKVKQTVLHSLGRLDVLRESGELDALLSSAQRFSEQCAVLDAHNNGESIGAKTHAIGPSLVFEKRCFAAAAATRKSIRKVQIPKRLHRSR